MHTGHALLLLSIAVTACAGASVQLPSAAVNARAVAQPASHAASRLGPPNPRGFGLRRVDRPIAAEAPLALY
jgi:hypothetical protein